MALWDEFLAPPPEARPRVWWHWMNGNIDEAGIMLDLEWMKRVGIGGAQVFEGGMNHPQVVSERLVFMSPEWKRAMRAAVQKADELDLELTIATSPGWSAAGGPWVDAADAMRKLVWSELIVDGGSALDVRLPGLPDAAGPYQDVERPGAAPRWSRTSRVLAIPEQGVRLRPTSIRSSTPVDDLGALTDGLFGPAVVLPRDNERTSTEWIEFSFDEPTAVGAITVGLPGRRGFGAPPPVRAVLESSADGERFQPVAELPASSSPVRSESFAPVTARWFRLVLTGEPAAASIPPMGEGVLPLPFPPPAAEMLVSEVEFWSDGRIAAAEVKAGFATTPDYYAVPTPTGVSGVPIGEVIDLTDAVDGDERLTWDAPAGRWRILRFGSSLTGQTNGPAPAEATGLEVDKLDPTRVERYLRDWLGIFRDAVGADLMGARGIRALLSDSIESGPQNCTDRLPEEFERRRGYSLTAWLPALAGFVLDSPERSDRFLWDYRQTIAELYADAYYGTIERIAHEAGLVYYAEALEDHRPQLGDDMQMRSHADVPMGAMWTPEEGRGFKPTYIADLRGASSVAHVYGKAFTGAESMSAFGHPYAYAPRDLKQVVDLELLLGVTRFCIHTSPHQPSEAPAPGVSLAPHLGQTFTRHETWAEQAGAWIDYLARSSWLLNAGAPGADIAYFFGEEAPLTAIFGDRLVDEVPAGFEFDFIGADGLASAVTVDEDGMLRSRGGAAYRLLYLGGTARRMTLRTLRRIAELIAGGALLVGERPIGSPSLSDDDDQFARLVDELWAPNGNGRSSVLTGTLEDALASERIEPRWVVAGGPLALTRRVADEGEILFVSNPTASTVSAAIRLRTAASHVQWWDAVRCRRSELDARRDGGWVEVDLALAAHESGFLLLSDEPASASVARHRRESVPIAGPWSVRFPENAGIPDREHAELALFGPAAEESVFSGTAWWSAEFNAQGDWSAGDSVTLRLGEVRDLAEVRLNGAAIGVTWTEPFELDISGAIRPGVNLLEIGVTNTWSHRLIGEARAAADGRAASDGFDLSVYRADAPTRPWGLAGPVALCRHGSSA
ncbi:glycosyl hydrolase [Naasia lichenicola]|uniref:Glycoside hydrolase n=1 Tax=Naasia lichenicola TaxID=2565933 RepID=A0A4S4FPX8_9MICO|nr:glycosyl hydrolase [Naasia lichenicola]THG31655.1 glycoside hydrolase [Naasia lichenicola]